MTPGWASAHKVFITTDNGSVVMVPWRVRRQSSGAAFFFLFGRTTRPLWPPVQ
jgi:hypothetical protein